MSTTARIDQPDIETAAAALLEGEATLIDLQLAKMQLAIAEGRTEDAASMAIELAAMLRGPGYVGLCVRAPALVAAFALEEEPVILGPPDHDDAARLSEWLTRSGRRPKLAAATRAIVELWLGEERRQDSEFEDGL